MGKREQNAQETCVAILETADRLIAERGYEQISVEEITRTAGIAKGTFYNYFKKKEDLIRALYHAHFAVLNDRIPALAEGAAVESLTRYLDEFAAVIEAAGAMQAREWARYMLLGQEGRSKWEDDTETLAGLIRRLQEHGQIVSTASADELAAVLMTQIYGIVFLWGIHPTRSPRMQVQEFCRVYLPALITPHLPEHCNG